MTGGEAIARMLKLEGIEVAFAIPDGTYWGIISNLKKFGIEMISCRHESSQLHAAGAYSKTSGKLAVVLLSNGPGVAAGLSGIAVEQAEGHRVFVISAHRRPEIAYPDRGGGYQVIDQVGAITPISKFSVSVKSHKRTIETMRQAFRKCYEGRPGVVHVDVAETVCNGKFDYEANAFIEPRQYRCTTPLEPSSEQVDRAAKMLVGAKFPVVHTGSGVIHAGAFDELQCLVDLLQMPVTTSWAARGAVCESNDLSVPMTSLEVVDDLRKEADLILTLGSRIGETDWWGKEPHWGNPYSQQMIQVDIDESAIGRNKPVALGIQADVKCFLRAVYERIRMMPERANVDQRKEQFGKHLVKQKKHRAKLDENLKDMRSPMNTAHVAHLAKKCFPKNSIAVFDGGNTAVWAMFFYKCTHPGAGISTPKMGMLGAGCGQAIGAAVADRSKTVYCIIGDGAMGYHSQEIETAVRVGLKVIYLVVCDKQWGMVRINQQFKLKPVKTVFAKRLESDEVINADFGEIEFDKLAQAMGAQGERVASPAELEAALTRCANHNGCSVVHIDVDPAKHLWAPGLRTFQQMHEEPKGNNGQSN